MNPERDVSQYAHTAWKIRDGVTRGIINAIVQTPDGYLWLGTQFGLLRFDGVKAIPWRPSANQHLPSEDIRSLLAARDGTLWIGTRNGLAGWKDGKLTVYPEFAGQMVVTLIEDREGTIWEGVIFPPAPGKLCEIRKGSVQCYGGDGSLGFGVVGLYEDSKGNLWAGVKDGVWRWKPGLPQFYSVPGETNGVQGIAEDSDGTLLIGTRRGIRRVVGGKIEAYPVPAPGRQFELPRLLRDREGSLWIGTLGQGLVHMHHGRIDTFQQLDGLSGAEIAALFEDREGDVWVATLNGLDRFREFAVATLGVNQGLSNGLVTSVLADRRGSVWVGTMGGLNQWRNGEITAFGKSGGKLNGRNPNSLYQDSRGRIWVSTLREFGYLEDGRFVAVSGVPGGSVDSIAEDFGGNLWIANVDRGLIRLSQGNEVQEIPWVNLGHFGNATALTADPVQGGLWLGFARGGVAYYKKGEVRASYTASDGLAEGYVADLRLDRDGTLWAAIEGGLSRLKDGRIATLTSKNGLPCDAIHWVMEDDYNSLWLYMDCALLRIAKPELDAWFVAADRDKNAKWTIGAAALDSFDGVRAFRGAGGAPRVAKADGRLWFSSVDGVSVVDPRHLPINKLPPPVHIEQVTADRKTYAGALGGTGEENGRLRLPPLVRDLAIDYTALSLVAPEKVRFRYKLEGRDRDWQDAGNRRQAFYTDLSPRNYRFRVIACNNSGVWNEAGTFLDFAVAPTYYQTLWFRLSCVAAFLALLAGLHRLRLRQLAQQYDVRMEERVSERTRIARELHDSLLQGFQGLMFHLVAVCQMLPGRPEEAREALESAVDRGEKAIAEGRDTVSDLRQSTVGGDITQALTALGEELAAQSDNGGVPCVRVLVEGKQRDLDPKIRDEIYRIAREALRNAFRHARAQKIEAELTYRDSELLFHVRDDGIGIPPEVGDQGARPGHWGLPGMRERTKKIGGRLEVWSKHGTGTEITVIVPAAIAYGKSNARNRFWFLPKKELEQSGHES